VAKDWKRYDVRVTVLVFRAVRHRARSPWRARSVWRSYRSSARADAWRWAWLRPSRCVRNSRCRWRCACRNRL